MINSTSKTYNKNKCYSQIKQLMKSDLPSIFVIPSSKMTIFKSISETYDNALNTCRSRQHQMIAIFTHQVYFYPDDITAHHVFDRPIKLAPRVTICSSSPTMSAVCVVKIWNSDYWLLSWKQSPMIFYNKLYAHDYWVTYGSLEVPGHILSALSPFQSITMLDLSRSIDMSLAVYLKNKTSGVIV